MRVLVLTNMWPHPGAPYRGIFVQRQVTAMVRAGLDVEVVSIEGFRSRLYYLRAAAKILLLNFGRARYDVFYGETGHCGILGCLQIRYPVVFAYVGYDLDVPAEDFENARTRFERFVFRHISCLVAGTIARSTRGRQRLPRCGQRRSTVLPYGVDRDLFRPMPRSEARRKLGWEHSGPTVLFAADSTRFTKRFELAEQAIAEVRKHLSEVDLVVAGSVAPDEMPVWMNAADVLILTSVAEGAPNVVKEAMACDLPVVSVDVGDVHDAIEGTRHCYVCPPNAEALAGALLKVIGALPERSDGRARSAHFGLDPIGERLRGLCEEASERGPGPLGFLPRGVRS